MPAIKQSRDKLANEKLVKLIDGNRRLNCEDVETITLCMHKKSPNTYRNYLRDPARFSVGDLRRIQKRYNIPPEAFLPGIFGVDS